jgi:formylglycine-generating enzyme required for sulfatase activity
MGQHTHDSAQGRAPTGVGSPQPVPLSVEDRFFLQIALKNNLVSPQDAARARQHAVQVGAGLSEALVALQILDEAQVRRVRQAMAASQVFRLDSVYADMALAAGLVSPEHLEAAFEEQRQQRFRARVGNILVDRGLIAPEAHRRVITQVIKRIKQQGHLAYSSTGSQTRPSLPAGPPPSGLSPSGLGRTAAEGSGQGSLPPPPPPPPLSAPPPPALRSIPATGKRPTIDLDETKDALPTGPSRMSDDLFGDSSETDFSPQGNVSDSGTVRDLSRLPKDADPLLKSAVAMGFSSGELSFDDDLLGDDRTPALEGDRKAPSANYVLDRLALSDGADYEEHFEPEQYLRQKRARGRMVVVAAGVTVLTVIVVVATVGAMAYSNSQAQRQVVALVLEAQASEDPDERWQLFVQAREELAGLGELGTDEEQKAALADQIRWGCLEAEALGELHAGRTEEARQMLVDRADDVPARAEEDYQVLLQDVARRQALRTGEVAERARRWPEAVVAYQQALKGGPSRPDGGQLADVASEARVGLGRIRVALTRLTEQALLEAQASLLPADEQAYAAHAKMLHELFGEDSGAREALADLALRRLRQEGEALFLAGDLDQAREVFLRARRAVSGDRDAEADISAWLQRISSRQDLEGVIRTARAAERDERWEEARRFYQRALGLSPSPQQAADLERGVARCTQELEAASLHQRRGELLQTAAGHLRAADSPRAQETLEELLALGDDAQARSLLTFARQVDGMAFVPGGSFLMGSPDGVGRPNEAPQRRVELGAFFIDRTEVTHESYAVFLAEVAGVAPPPHWTVAVPQPDGSVVTTYRPSLADYPVVNVSWSQARRYAEWRGGRLPSEAQWEKAARGEDGRSYPWGEGTSVDAHVAVPPNRLREVQTAPVGSHRGDVSPFGVYDMAGNVNEWTADVYQPYPGAPDDSSYPTDRRRVLRGGAHLYPYSDARCAYRDGAREDYLSAEVGLRVVVEVPAGLSGLLE